MELMIKTITSFVNTIEAKQIKQTEVLKFLEWHLTCDIFGWNKN
jgi:hypothetical protein